MRRSSVSPSSGKGVKAKNTKQVIKKREASIGCAARYVYRLSQTWTIDLLAYDKPQRQGGPFDSTVKGINLYFNCPDGATSSNGNLGRGVETSKEITMPQGDRTGPTGQGPGTGRGMGRGGGGRGGGGRGGGGGGGAGTGGNCICQNCGERVPHQRGNPCFEEKCPKCGGAMTRE